MIQENLYVVSAELNDWIGKADFTPDIEFPWDDVSVAKKVEITFKMTIKWKRLKKIDLDFFRELTPIVSENFIAVCGASRVDFQAVPLDIVLNGSKVQGKFYFLLLNQFVSIVNVEKTPHIRMKTRDGKSYQERKFFPEIPLFEKLENIVINDKPKPPFFMAPEIEERVCTEEFKNAVERAGIKGIQFRRIDEKFKYHPVIFQ